MPITSLNFFVFVAVVLAVYYFCVPKKFQWCVLLIAGYIFYGFADWRLLIFIYTTTVTVYYGGLWLGAINSASKEEKNAKWHLRMSPKLIVAIIAITNFAILASFKWWNTLANTGNNMLSLQLPLNSLLLPLGISFYTFQAIGYLVDVYRDTIKPEPGIARFALFVSFFPQLIQGPISRHSELAEQLYTPRKFDHKQTLHGFQLMLWGLFKKLVIADRLVLMSDAIFSNSEEYKGLYVLIGMIVYTVWLYMDFSGGVDIARGVGQMFGIIMPQNFMRPFFATSLPDFWRRFHISLNDWWRDYLFYPIVLSKPMANLSKFVRNSISRSLGKAIGIYIAIIIVRIVNAMWLGSNLFYMANGLYYGVLIVLAMLLAPVFKKAIETLKINTSCFSWKLFQIIRTFMLNCIGHIFLATSGIIASFTALASIVKDFNPWILNFESVFLVGLDEFDARIVLVSLAVVLIAEIMREKGIALRETLQKQNMAFQWLIMMLGLWVLIIFGRYGIGYDPSDFLYMGF